MECDQFKRVLSRLELYYLEADNVISTEGSSSLLTPITSKINSYTAYLEKLFINLPTSLDPQVKSQLENALKEQHSKKSKFDSNVTEYLKCLDVPSTDIATILSAPRTLRSQKSITITTTSTYKNAQLVANEQLALLKLSHLEEQQQLEREESELKYRRELEETERKRGLELEEADLKRRRDMLKAMQELKEASLQRQVIEEETERGGYISTESNHFKPRIDLTSQPKENCGKVPPSIKTQQKFSERNQTDSISQRDLCNRASTSKALHSASSPFRKQIDAYYPPKQSLHPSQPYCLNYDQEADGGSATNLNRPETRPFRWLNALEQHQPQSIHLVSKPRTQNNDMADPVHEEMNLAQPREENKTRSSQAGFQSSVENKQLLNMAAALQLSREIPQLEVVKFNGDPSTYAKFMHSFELIVNAANLSNCKKLMYLVQYCESEAKQLIEYCLLLDPDNGYPRALKLLKDNYGRPNVIARSYCDKLTKGPYIKIDDYKGLGNLAQLLEESEVTMRSLNYHADLDNFNTILAIVKRLPFALQTRWLRTATEIEKRGTDPKFKNLVKFVQDEAEIANSSYASAINQRNKKKSGYSFFAKSSKPKGTTMNERDRNKTKHCVFCEDDHKIDDCTKFAELAMHDRISFNRKNRLCDNCFRGGHISSYCKSNSSCTIKGCSRKHHTLLHRDFNSLASVRNQNESNAPSTSKSLPETSRAVNFSTRPSSSDVDCVFLNVVPVNIFAKGREVYTYAFLDQGSTTTLCEQSLFDQLGIEGENVSINLTTVNHRAASHESKRVSLTVTGVASDESIELNEVYSVASLPIKPNKPLTANEIKSWPHLRELHLPTISSSVGLLIGIDNPELFWTLEEIRGNRGEPFAVRTILGWSLVGAISRFQQNTKSINVNFVRRTDQELEDQMERLWQMDLLPDPATSDTGLSKEDKLALNTMKQSIRLVDGHYQIALPWKPGAPNFVNNRCLAELRLNALQKKLDKNLELKQKYTAVVEDYLAKGYAEKVETEKSYSEMCWYLPHHAVLNPRKPDKVRVVFDCSATFQKQSLNQQLLQGPDFLNSLVGVLLRFRKGKIAMSNDIEAMFHQVKVEPKDQPFLRFLWWPQGNTTLPPEDYCMKVHLFGATSSPSCANFSLLRTADDNSGIFDPVILETVKKNFYMDDCLKSVASEEDAFWLFQNLTDLLQKGGFHLTKWISSSSEVLKKIPDVEKSSSAFNLDKNSNLRVLGVKWDFNQDKFQFESSVQKKPLTRRGILSVVSSIFDPLGFVAPVILTAKLLLQDFCRQRLDWDDRISEEDAMKWNQWINNLHALVKLDIPRYLFPRECDFTSIKSIQIHHFSDASSCAYGVVTYLRCVLTNDDVFCRFVFGKSRLAPLKTISIPRL